MFGKREELSICCRQDKGKDIIGNNSPKAEQASWHVGLSGDRDSTLVAPVKPPEELQLRAKPIGSWPCCQPPAAGHQHRLAGQAWGQGAGKPLPIV